MLKSAAEAFPKDETVRQELVLAAHSSGQYEQAVEFATQGVRQHPRSHWLWRQLGNELTTVDRLDEAEKALENARNINGNDEWLWRYYAALHRKRKNLESEIRALEKLFALGNANSTDLNHLGIAYHNHENFAKAVEFYRRSAAESPDTAPLFNMGLVFSHAEVSQDADAADAYRRALDLNPKYEKAKERLEVTKQKLLPLADRARSEAKAMVQAEDYFQFYQNPFEVFPIEFDGALSDLDAKAIQRAKKKLFGEIELNDGRVEWLENQPVDKSRALALEDELLDDEKRRFHWAVFDNKRLLRFLTRGEIEHFLYSDEYFPKELLELLDEEPEFRRFLSKPFARQYNTVLTRAIEKRAFCVVEALFDGRRWVEPEDEDVCFEGAYKHTKMLIEWVEKKAETAASAKPDYSEIAAFIENLKVAETFNLLPTAFRSVQSQLVGQIRSLAIAANNEHSDSESSAQILGLCKKFRFKSADLNKRLEEDAKAIEKIVADNRKNSFSAWVRQDQAIYITHTGIKYAGEAISAADVEAIRWGIYVHTINGAETEHSFTLVVSSHQTNVEVRWDKRGLIGGVKSLFRKKDDVVPISQLPTANQDAYFRKMIDAVIHHLIPPLIGKLVQRLRSGIPITIGQCTLSQIGVSFQKGIFFRKNHVVPWDDVDTNMQSGEVVVFSKTNRKAQVSMPARSTDNAVILPILCAAMRDQSN